MSAILSIFIKIENSPDRLTQSTTMFLTSIAYQFIVGNMLPKLNYRTIIDKYILGCNLFIVSIMLQNAFVCLLTSYLELSNNIDIGIILINIFLLII